MPKWSEMLARLIPWLATQDEEHGQALREDAEIVCREQQELSPLIDAQTAYLVKRGGLNGFSRQLRIGFERNTVGE